MAHPSVNSTTVLLVLSPLIVWRVVARFRRLVGPQRLSRIRPWITVTLFPTLVLLLACAAWPRTAALGCLAAGLGLGALLAVVGWRLTTFERTPRGWFYTPNAHLGIALSLLFVARILYRVVQVYTADPVAGPPEFVSSPLTLIVFGTMAGYYVGYAVGLIRWRLRLLQAKRAAEEKAAARDDDDART